MATARPAPQAHDIGPHEGIKISEGLCKFHVKAFALPDPQSATRPVLNVALRYLGPSVLGGQHYQSALHRHIGVDIRRTRAVPLEPGRL